MNLPKRLGSHKHLQMWLFSVVISATLFLIFPYHLTLSFIPLQLNILSVAITLSFLYSFADIHLLSSLNLANQDDFDVLAVQAVINFFLLIFFVADPARFVWGLALSLIVLYLEQLSPQLAFFTQKQALQNGLKPSRLRQRSLFFVLGGRSGN